MVVYNNNNDCFLIEFKKDFQISRNDAVQIAGYAQWMANYKTHLNKIYPIIVVGSLREIKHRNYKYHKFDSIEDKVQLNYSEYYSNVLKEKTNIIANFKKYNIPKTQPLQFFTYILDDSKLLTKFELI